MRSDPKCQLYLITPPDFRRVTSSEFAYQLASVLDSGNIACVQLRLKDTPENIAVAADQLIQIVQDRDVAFILNDNPVLATKLGCDGVHIGQNDASYQEARQLLGQEGIVGVTCHNSIHLAMEAAEAGADYVAFGAFYESSTKPRQFEAKTKLLDTWTLTTTVPSVAIGGITVENCLPIVEAGADFIAVSEGIWGHIDGPAKATQAFNDVLLGS